jgi:hypothetical protein
LSDADIKLFFRRYRIDTSALSQRGPALSLRDIAKDDRYLISEMACKSFGRPIVGAEAELRQALRDAYSVHQRERGRKVTIRELLDGKVIAEDYQGRQQQFVFSADEMLDQEIVSTEDLEAKYEEIARTFDRAREAALENTQLYLSMAEELDVYVATSMRTRQDFREMADFCDGVFEQSGLKYLNIRYFDPTRSAADGHEDKGIIECLMVKCSKVLVYSAGTRDSWGKDAEAAMALSQGKPVIIFCDNAERERFFRDVHPLSRLIDFESGVPVGAMVTSDKNVVTELLARIFENRMDYELEQPQKGYLRLRERKTNSVVRLQTSNPLLRETFWNYYHRKPKSVDRFPGVGVPQQ